MKFWKKIAPRFSLIVFAKIYEGDSSHPMCQIKLSIFNGERQPVGRADSARRFFIREERGFKIASQDAIPKPYADTARGKKDTVCAFFCKKRKSEKKRMQTEDFK